MTLINLSLKWDTNKISNLMVNLESWIELALLKVGLTVQNKAKLNAPYDRGTLRRSISTDFSRLKSGMVVVGSPLAYSRIREFVNKKNPSRKFYLKRAYSENRSEILWIINTALKTKLW